MVMVSSVRAEWCEPVARTVWLGRGGAGHVFDGAACGHNPPGVVAISAPPGYWPAPGDTPFACGSGGGQTQRQFHRGPSISLDAENLSGQGVQRSSPERLRNRLD